MTLISRYFSMYLSGQGTPCSPLRSQEGEKGETRCISRREIVKQVAEVTQAFIQVGLIWLFTQRSLLTERLSPKKIRVIIRKMRPGVLGLVTLNSRISF